MSGKRGATAARAAAGQAGERQRRNQAGTGTNARAVGLAEGALLNIGRTRDAYTAHLVTAPADVQLLALCEVARIASTAANRQPDARQIFTREGVTDQLTHLTAPLRRRHRWTLLHLLELLVAGRGPASSDDAAALLSRLADPAVLGLAARGPRGVAPWKALREIASGLDGLSVAGLEILAALQADDPDCDRRAPELLAAAAALSADGERR